MPTDSPPWHWTWDKLPTAGDQVYIRILSPANKPALAAYNPGEEGFTVLIDGTNYLWPTVLVVQWRAGPS